MMWGCDVVLTFTSIFYDVLVLQLWAPLYHCLSETSVADRRDIHHQILSTAEHGLRVITSLHKETATRYSMPDIAFCVCQLGEIMLNYGTSIEDKITSTRLCLDVLETNRVGFHVCGPLAQLFCQSALDQGVDIDTQIPDHLIVRDQYGIEEILASTTRLSYSQPLWQMRRWMHNDIGDEWHDKWEECKNGNQRSMRLTDVLNK